MILSLTTKKILNQANIASSSTKKEYKKRLLEALSQLSDNEAPDAKEGTQSFSHLNFSQDSQDPFEL
ncbi:MAG: hypothetical protein O7C60_07070 [Rickettsia endosymbiont of Ixodes persulcatus]|nr:hypothetical protein [Rickettsia endosymbiont of Ixodes persulcatus]